MNKIIIMLSLLISVSAGNATAIKLHTKTTIDSVYICQSRSAYAYHSHICRGLARCTHGIVKLTKAQAIKIGYKPCKICYWTKQSEPFEPTQSNGVGASEAKGPGRESAATDWYVVTRTKDINIQNAYIPLWSLLTKSRRAKQNERLDF